MSVSDSRQSTPESQQLATDYLAYHLQVADLKTLLIANGEATIPLLHVRSLTAMATKDALDALVEHYAPNDMTVRLAFERPASVPGVDVVVEASRWMFKARLRAQIRLQEQSMGVVTLDLVPGRRWSPTDLTALAIMHRQIGKVARERAEIVETGSRSFEIDIQYLVNDVLSNGDLPVQWGTMLSDIRTSADEIRFHFTPVPGLLEVTKPGSI